VTSQILLDGVQVYDSLTSVDVTGIGTGRQWALTFETAPLTAGAHTIDIQMDATVAGMTAHTVSTFIMLVSA
jgi:hypothetical protein